MARNLEEMSFQELGQLFPILLVAYNPNWISCYEKEKEAILQKLGEGAVEAIHHIGSTVVPGMIAKPTIDILLEIKQHASPEAIKESLGAIGYR